MAFGGFLIFSCRSWWWSKGPRFFSGMFDEVSKVPDISLLFWVIFQRPLIFIWYVRWRFEGFWYFLVVLDDVPKVFDFFCKFDGVSKILDIFSAMLDGVWRVPNIFLLFLVMIQRPLIFHWYVWWRFEGSWYFLVVLGDLSKVLDFSMVCSMTFRRFLIIPL